MPEQLRFDDVVVVEITDTNSLLKEGGAMRHCVAGYGSACLMGDRMIISLRASDGRHLSTAELRIQAFPALVEIVQHKGPENRPPSDVCVAAIDKVVQHLSEKKYHGRIVQRREFQTWRLRSHHDLHAIPDSAIDAYRRVEEETAWSIVYGRSEPSST